MERRRLKIQEKEKDEGSVTEKQRVVRDKEAKRRGKVGRSVIVGVEGEEYIYIFLFKQGEEKFKKKKENVENN